MRSLSPEVEGGEIQQTCCSASSPRGVNDFRVTVTTVMATERLPWL